jgi:hypothetical protein
MKLKLFLLFLSLAANFSQASKLFPLTAEHCQLSLSLDYNKVILHGCCEIEILNQSDQKAGLWMRWLNTATGDIKCLFENFIFSKKDVLKNLLHTSRIRDSSSLKIC